MPRVSVVIPVYNGERFIGDAIQSVLNQTFKDFEIIVVDDGSTDGTERVVHGFSGSISYHRQENQGAGVARNTGVSLARAEWVAFLDADDVWYPDKLAIQLEHVQTYPEVCFFYSDIDAVDEEGRTLPGFLGPKLERRRRKRRKNLASIIFGDFPVPNPPTVLVRKDVFFKAGGFNPLFHGRYHEDFELFARIARISPLHYIPQSLAKCRVRVSKHASMDLIWESNWLIFLNCLWQMWSDEPERHQVLLREYAKYFSDIGRRCLKSGDYRKARLHFRTAYGYYPFYYKNLRRWLSSYL